MKCLKRFRATPGAQHIEKGGSGEFSRRRANFANLICIPGDSPANLLRGRRGPIFIRLSRYSLNSERSSKNLSHCNSRNTGSTEPTLWSVERTPSGSEPERESSSERMAYTPNIRAIGTKRRSDFRRTIIQNIKIGVHFEFAMYLHLKTKQVGKA